MFETALKILVALLCPPIAFGFGKAILDIAAHSDDRGGIVWFVSGMVCFVPAWIIFRRRLELFAIFEHEITHALFGLLFFKIPRSISVDHDRGEVWMAGGNFVITLAPYFFPTISFALLLFLPLVGEAWFWLYSVLLGLSVGFHIASTKSEIHYRQTDLHEAGLVFSSIFIPVASLVFYGSVFAVVITRGEKFLDYWLTGGAETYAAIRSAVLFFQ